MKQDIKARELMIRLHVAEKLKQRRKFLNQTQAAIAHQLGITAQQFQKYEKGIDKISAEKLLGFSQILSVPLTFFYEGLLPEK